MSDAIDLEIVTPERKVLTVKASEVVVPGIDGYFGVLPGHAPFLTRLGVGEISYKDATGTHYLAVADGVVEVLPHRVTILAQPVRGVARDRRRARARGEAPRRRDDEASRAGYPTRTC